MVNASEGLNLVILRKVEGFDWKNGKSIVFLLKSSVNIEQKLFFKSLLWDELFLV